MEFRIPRPGDIYKHFKGNLYEVIIIARDSETLEEKVVYKEVNGEAAYVRSLPMFCSLVDKDKYPNVTQEYRFEYVEGHEVQNDEVEIEEEAVLEDASLIIGFLDEESVKGKINYLIKAKDSITDSFLEIAAQSLDFVESEKDLYNRYEAILQYLKTVEKYERER